MSEVALTPVSANWTISGSLTMSIDTTPVLGAASVIVPYNIAHYMLDEYRMKNGWPEPIPTHDIRAQGMISTNGDVFANRLHPTQISTDAYVRWVANADYWNPTTLTWTPFAGNPMWTWKSAAPYGPVLFTDSPYRIGSQLITRDVLHCDSAARQHLWSSFPTSSPSFSLLMVCSIVSGFGAGSYAPLYGILNPGMPTPGTDTFAETTSGAQFGITLQANTLFGTADDSGPTPLFQIAQALSHAGPAYLGITVSYPKLTVYLGLGPSNIQVASIEMTSQVPNSLDWVLGRTTGTVLHSADMSIYDVGFYVDALTGQQMLAEVATLAGAYGGS